MRQWHRHGLIGFAARYRRLVRQVAALPQGHWGAYRRIPFEIEADWVAQRLEVTSS